MSEELMFPFLIGRIRTREGIPLPPSCRNMFPFLIGRIRTTEEELDTLLEDFCFHSS